MTLAVQPPPIKDSMLSRSNVLSQIWTKWFMSLFKAQVNISDLEIKELLKAEPVNESSQISQNMLKELLESGSAKDYSSQVQSLEVKGLLESDSNKDYSSQVQNLEMKCLLEQQNVNSTWEGRIKAIEQGSQWPIGSVFISVVSTDPATLLGFGTWSAVGAGRVLVGLDSGDTDFDTVEETGGAKTSTPDAHAGAAVDAHSGTAVASHTITENVQGALAGDVVTTATHSVTQPSDHVVTQPNTHSALSIVQPYFVVYMWKRTA